MSDVTVPDRGTPVWNSGGATTISPLIAGETVVSVDDGLTALDAETGNQKWQTDLDSDPSSASLTQPSVADGNILLGSKGQLRSFDLEDGSEQWVRKIDGAPIGPITVGPDNQIGIVPFERPEKGDSVIELVAFAVSSGETEWTAPLLVSVRTTPPAIFDSRVYTGGYTRDETPIIRCLDADSGELVWERELDDPATQPVATEDGIIVGDGGSLIVYDPAEGERLASIDVTDREIRAIAIADGMAFVLSYDGLIALSISDGSEHWSVKGDPQADGLAVGRNTVVAPISSDAFDLDTSWPCIAAFDRSDGTTRWYYTIDDTFDPAISAPPVIADGAVFAMSNKRSGITALGDLPPEED
ncbi:PQQ-binding-like beta-propeller repeat protein [Natribaculum luteum]|uniref:PQQ-binding-like beta-propeller repeat protein n=1 Tax=Natribaculum luteum TaxID=1586232 RepID=A0ABD5NYV3_9EURY|nr:PQQ-binding-like beta-propeller repeat protein [Natribaculum luteum]